MLLNNFNYLYIYNKYLENKNKKSMKQLDQENL